MARQKKEKVQSEANIVADDLLNLHRPNILNAEEIQDFPRQIEVDNKSYLDIQTKYKTQETGRIWVDGKEIICITLIEKYS